MIGCREWQGFYNGMFAYKVPECIGESESRNFERRVYTQDSEHSAFVEHSTIYMMLEYILICIKEKICFQMCLYLQNFVIRICLLLPK